MKQTVNMLVLNWNVNLHIVPVKTMDSVHIFSAFIKGLECREMFT